MNRSEIIPWLTSGWRLIVLLIVALGLIALIWWAYSDSSEKEMELIGNISEQNGQNAVIGNLVGNQQNVVNGKANITNQRLDELNRSINRPSNSFNGAGADDRFCRNFPNDPSCQP